MDYDDGLLLNFATDTTSPSTTSKNTKTKIVGGRWKDRRKLIQNSKRKSTPNLNNYKNNQNYQKHKRKRDQNDTINSSRSASLKKPKYQEKHGQFGGKNSSFVSSLFTSKNKSQNQFVIPSNAPLKNSNFEDLGINSKLAKYLNEKLHYSEPTVIQKYSIPNLIKKNNNFKNDLFIKSQTGSGKTLAFLLPIFNNLMILKNQINRDSGLFAIILTPTRELALQIHAVLDRLSKISVNIVSTFVIGGEKKKSEKARLRKGINILIATPGRLLDHIKSTKNLDLGSLKYLVLDEGDKLMELGFEQTLTEIIQNIEEQTKNNENSAELLNLYPELPNRRVTILCSATLKDNVKKLGEISLNNPLLISSNANEENGNGVVTFNNDDTGNVNETFNNNKEISSAPDQLLQQAIIVPPKLRLVSLNGILHNLSSENQNSNTGSRIIVFLSCSDSVDFHFKIFSRNGRKIVPAEKKEADNNKSANNNSNNDSADENVTISSAPLIGENTIAYKLHGSLTQQLRSFTLNHFSNPKINSDKNLVLFCTDVVSRGLDLPLVSTVIEYDPPFTIEDHLHRVGRTARVGNQGNAMLFLFPELEENYVEKIKEYHTNGQIQKIQYDEILKKVYADPNSKRSKWDIEATTWHLNVERWLLAFPSVLEFSKNAFISHIRAYTTHLNSEKDCFNVKKLHLGHIAKSFGLRETPKNMGAGANKSNSRPKKPKESSKNKMLRMANLTVKSSSSEFNFM
ncbi:putative ATP-dependent RNA helicase [Ascoidea rubescens DSM 1968]|uniref:ATP-dependent RNA helicase n=1 Tax=Ascoidea rubescens DSM 1968 TaxID=1344418 RepID=A0A1D2VB55_9ASCO|nr:DEAD-domain-containing protein [Ascoidea rubescens DSM 1968]ODV58825.1 DEAD-domain-containing protein [Ascoidea rubescens DSM 1968]